MCELTHESIGILTLVMFDAELNSLSDDIIFKEGHFRISKILSQNTSETRKFSLVFAV